MVIVQGRPKSTVTGRFRLAASTTPATLLGPRPARQKLVLVNSAGAGGSTFYVAFGSGATSTNFTLSLGPGDLYEDTSSIDSLSVVADGNAAGDYLMVSEMA